MINYKERQNKLTEVLETRKLDGYVVTGVSDLGYLTGLQSEGFSGLATAEKIFLFTSPLLAEQLRERAVGCRVIVGKRLSRAAKDICKKYGFKRIGFDQEQVSYRLGTELKKQGFRACDNPLRDLRIIKEKQECAFISKACRISANAVAHLEPRLRVGMTEKQMVAEITSFFYRQNADRQAFDVIAAVGKNTALPHHQPGETRLTRHQPVLLDLGCTVGGYGSDLTRTLFYGMITPAFKRVHRIVQEAQTAGLAQVRAGIKARQVDSAARQCIQKAGYGRFFVHGTGHGVGLDIHEPPWISRKGQDLLKPGMVLTVEPGIYLPGRFGIRIEDTVLVTQNGREVLTKS